ncbi:MalM family protein [Celerinatantimonas sp. MCCC 1A17872]|uniref:MalM family protein n=1 Tax=Celerinatantimonas sp. MCCC 1A17872 TaxID=3177514 RepID=UPI0038BFC98D
MKQTVLVGLLLGLSGCVSVNNSQPSADNSLATSSAQFESTIQGQTVCCSTYQSMPYKVIHSAGEYKLAVTPQSPVFNFAEGKSRFAAYKFIAPQTYSDFKVTLTFDIRQQLFLPKAVILDDNFHVTGVLDNQFFAKSPNYYHLKSEIERQIVMGNAQHRYLVLYQPNDQLSQTFQVESQKAIFNRVHAYAPPPDPLRYQVMRYRPVGNFVLDAESVSLVESSSAYTTNPSSSQVVNQVKPEIQQPKAEIEPKQTSQASVTKVASKQESVDSRSINLSKAERQAVIKPDGKIQQHPVYLNMPNTHFYSSKPYELQMIEQRLLTNIEDALKGHDYQHAIELYQQAKRQGVADASEIFAEALDKLPQ